MPPEMPWGHLPVSLSRSPGLPACWLLAAAPAPTALYLSFNSLFGELQNECFCLPSRSWVETLTPRVTVFGGGASGSG